MCEKRKCASILPTTINHFIRQHEFDFIYRYSLLSLTRSCFTLYKPEEHTILPFDFPAYSCCDGKIDYPKLRWHNSHNPGGILKPKQQSQGTKWSFLLGFDFCFMSLGVVSVETFTTSGDQEIHLQLECYIVTDHSMPT